MDKNLIARVAHEINRAYCASIGDDSQPAWDEAPEWQRSSALLGVEMHINNPDATPEQSHESWLAQKLADGWKHGPVKDAEKKEHPCVLPYAELPAEQKSKDFLFRGVVHALKDIPGAGEGEAGEVVELRAKVAALTDQLSALQKTVVEQPGTVPPKQKRTALPASGLAYVKYSGRKPYQDKTPLRNVWSAGDVKPVPVRDAEALLKFVEFELVEKPASTAAAGNTVSDDEAEVALAQKAQATKELDEQAATNAILMTIDTMDKDALEAYARKYEVEIDKRRGVAKICDEVKGLVEQYGAR